MPEPLRPLNRPRILLLDCSNELRDSLKQTGYDVEVGYTGFFAEHSTMEIPSNLHEKELLVIDLDPGWTPRPFNELYPLQTPPGELGPPRGDHAREPRLNGEPLARFTDALERGAVLVVLMEGEMKPVGFDPDPGSPIRGGSFGWLPVPGVKMRMAVFDAPMLHTIGIADDELMIVDQTDEVLEDLRDMLARHPDAKSFRTLEGCEHPLLANAANEEKAGLISVHGKDPFALSGLELLLPYFPRKGAALHQLLGVLATHAPELFPPRTPAEWADDDDYQLPAVQQVRARRHELQADHEVELERLSTEEADAKADQAPLMPLLHGVKGDLHAADAVALERLGFAVVDVDTEKATIGGEREEDLRLDDPDDPEYLGVVDAAARKGNVTQKDYQDMRTYIGIRAKDSRFSGREIQGLLVVNQNYSIAPDKRDPLFSTDSRDWNRILAEEAITAISSWDLFQLVGRVQSGQMTQGDARAVIRRPGIVRL